MILSLLTYLIAGAVDSGWPCVSPVRHNGACVSSNPVSLTTTGRVMELVA